MTWIIAIVCFLAGAAAGALLFKIYMSDEARVQALEAELQKLSDEHENYKTNVHTHFSNSARLLNEMTESYRNVYTHMANGAQSLCPDYISSQLTLGNDKDLLGKHNSFQGSPEEDAAEPAPPLDYAAKSKPGQKGSLAEDYGIEKPEKLEDSY